MVTPMTAPGAGDFDIWARTVWGEARGEPFAGQLAVAHVILNRTLDIGNRWPRTIHDTCLQPLQFSCWNQGDPNVRSCRLITYNDVMVAKLLRLVIKVWEGGYDDPTLGANHYHATSIAPPSWVGDAQPTALIGRHRFYRL